MMSLSASLTYRPAKSGTSSREDSVQRHRARERFDAGRFHHAIVVFTERGRHVHETGTGFGRDVVVTQHDERPCSALVGEVREQRFV